MTKFEKCVVVWLVYFGFAAFPLIMAIHVAGNGSPRAGNAALLVMLGLSFAAALILTIVFCALKGQAKSQENQ